MDNLAVSVPSINGKVSYFHLCRGLVDYADLEYLGRYCEYVDVRKSRHPRMYSLTVVSPQKEALLYLQEIGWQVNCAEIALDLECNVEEMVEFFDSHFVHKHHRSRKTVKVGDTTYTGQGKHAQKFCWYEKFGLFHVESRLRGRDRLNAIGISEASHMLRFDFEEYWASKLNFYAVDRSRLGARYSSWTVQELVDHFGLASRRAKFMRILVLS